MNRSLILPLILLLLGVACGPGQKQEPPPPAKEVSTMPALEDENTLNARLNRLAPVELGADLSGLGSGDRQALDKLVAAADLIQEIFLLQVDSRNPEWRKALAQSQDTRARLARELFDVHAGPWDRTDEQHPFMAVGSKRPGAGFYPPELTREALEAWLETHPGMRDTALSNFTLLESSEGTLTPVPYSVAYHSRLEQAARLLREAADLTPNASLKTYLCSRADAFLSNEYRQSDMDWMDLRDHDLEVVIGPYEVYEDGLMGQKAAFECFITLVDHAASASLQGLSAHQDLMEQAFPLAPEQKKFTRGKTCPIIVADELYTAGDTRAGVQTTAFNLPNDEKVRELKGSKKVMLRNVARAKFEQCWMPIAKEVLAEKEMNRVSFDAYFTHVLLHEISHGLGPGTLNTNGRDTTVNRELRERYSTIEETKADILGVYNILTLLDKGLMPKELGETLYATYLGGIFRSVRFGIGEAHGGANAIQLNFILEQGGFAVDPETGRYQVVPEKMRQAVTALSREILLIELSGDYDRAGRLMERYQKMDEPLKRALERTAHVPIDIRPRYTLSAS